MPATIAVLASGNGSNLQAIIDAAETGQLGARVGLVLCDKKQAYALERAQNHGIPAAFIDRKTFKNRIEFDAELAGQIKKAGCELVVLAGFMRILSKDFIDQFPMKIMNIHPALLPSFPGLDAIKQALEYGARYCGSTVHFVDSGVDTGPIILQKAVEISHTDDLKSLTQKVQKIEHELYPRAIKLFIQNKLKIEGRVVTITQ